MFRGSHSIMLFGFTNVFSIAAVNNCHNYFKTKFLPPPLTVNPLLVEFTHILIVTCH